MVKLEKWSYDHTTYCGEISLSKLNKKTIEKRDVIFTNYQKQKNVISLSVTGKTYFIETKTSVKSVYNVFYSLKELKKYISSNAAK